MKGPIRRDTRASAWYKAVATRAFSHTEAFDCATTPYHRLFSSQTSSTNPSSRRPISPTTRFTSCSSDGIPSTETRSRLNPRSRVFDNQVGSQALYAMGRDLAANVIDRHRQRLH